MLGLPLFSDQTQVLRERLPSRRQHPAATNPITENLRKQTPKVVKHLGRTPKS